MQQPNTTFNLYVNLKLPTTTNRSLTVESGLIQTVAKQVMC